LKKFISISICVLISAVFACRVATAEAPDRIRVVTANVGNADLVNCGPKYLFKLCLVEWERKIADGIAALSPDIISLQEVYDIKWCEQKGIEKDAKKVCHNFRNREPLHQGRRLLGPEYTIVCDGRSNFECLGVKISAGTINGCPAGELCREGVGLTHELPEGCEPYPVIFGADAVIHGVKMRIVNGHPAASDRVCRAGALTRMFEGYEDVPALAIADRPVLIMGDMNMDPYVGDPLKEDVAIWQKYVGGGKPFHYLSGIAEHQPPYPTNAGRAIDHMISNSLHGKCVTLGVAPGTARLDGLPAGKPITDGPDHNALLCDVELPKADGK